MSWTSVRSQCRHRVIANGSLYNGERYTFVLIVAGGWNIVQRREERIFADHRKKKRRSNRQPPAAARGRPPPWCPAATAGGQGKEHATRHWCPAAHSPASKRPFVQPRSAATDEGCGGTLPPRCTQAHARTAAGTRVGRQS